MYIGTIFALYGCVIFFLNSSVPCLVWVFEHDCLDKCCFGYLILRVSDQNGVSLLYIMLEMHHSGREPSNYVCILYFCFALVQC